MRYRRRSCHERQEASAGPESTTRRILSGELGIDLDELSDAENGLLNTTLPPEEVDALVDINKKGASTKPITRVGS